MLLEAIPWRWEWRCRMPKPHYEERPYKALEQIRILLLFRIFDDGASLANADSRIEVGIPFVSSYCSLRLAHHCYPC